jgi:alkylation response protein AidB-like acyl-CoA dehydrogenase
VDRGATFPEQSIAALKAAGVLGAVSAPEVGGLGLGVRGAVEIVGRVAQECGSTAMIACMHYCGTVVLEAFATEAVRRAAASGETLITLAFSEAGSRSHFWARWAPPRPRATASLNAQKERSAPRLAPRRTCGRRAIAAEGLSTILAGPGGDSGLTVQGPFEGLGLRGMTRLPSSPMDVKIPRTAMLGEDGAAKASAS